MVCNSAKNKKKRLNLRLNNMKDKNREGKNKEREIKFES